MRIIVLGLPGAGKGTQAEFIAKRLDIPKISTGDMLRAAVKAKTSLGSEVKKIMEEGGLVSDDIIIALVKKRVNLPDCRSGYLLDGFPRTTAQAEALHSQKIKIDLVIDIDVPEEEIIERMTGRLLHPVSGRTYHRRYNPPKIPGKDDLTSEPLVQRADDHEETVRKRLAIYKQQTSPVSHYYIAWEKSGNSQAPHYYRISGLGTMDEVRERILNVLNSEKFTNHDNIIKLI
ncbi:adenylate kinase [Coxiella endosymbiont of Rhipicephalus microplus]|uniref:adenylate kinase n=1 Tax=Coxiella endosymbiont of Rhipicephalus microplus TaxID=1656186 RepID=UPI000C7F88DA|nr:adenylate kinase [Coxiella endosymbiont of Rhipicephalus microplus]PMB54382.1 Adenylate kinase [Coxiella-like endosymbiont]